MNQVTTDQDLGSRQDRPVANALQGYLTDKKTSTLLGPPRTVGIRYGRVLGGCVCEVPLHGGPRGWCGSVCARNPCPSIVTTRFPLRPTGRSSICPLREAPVVLDKASRGKGSLEKLTSSLIKLTTFLVWMHQLGYPRPLVPLGGPYPCIV